MEISSPQTSIREQLNIAFGGGSPEEREWLVQPVGDARFGWIEVTYRAASRREQGWKLHVSATVQSAPAVLEAVLPLLKAGCVSFKVCRSLEDLQYLNSGNAGLTQVGKFITIYPGDDEQLVQIALALDAATSGLAGPAVPSDRPLRTGSLVHYRYGAFRDIWLQESTGQVVRAIRTPDGNLEADVRSTASNAPVWATDQFEARGLVAPYAPSLPLLAGRYLCFASIHEAAKGIVYLALDIDDKDARQCIVKQARRHVPIDMSELDALALLRNEKRILEKVSAAGFAPRVYDYFELDGDAYLVLEFIEAANLRSHIFFRACRGLLFDRQEVIGLGLEISGILQHLHARNIVHRDLKPANFLWSPGSPGSGIKAVDFELSYDRDSDGGVYPIAGTRGYRSPQQSAGLEPSVTDDVFGLGALLYLLATNCDPSLAPREWSFSERWINRLNPRIGRELQEIIARCLDVDALARYQTIADVHEALAGIESRAVQLDNATGGDVDAPDSTSCLDISRLIGERLCALAVRSKAGVSWASSHPLSDQAVQRDINVGATGIGLFLLDLYLRTGSAPFLDTAHDACEWLMAFDHDKQPFLPGLFVGESGAGLFALYLGRALDSSRHVEWSMQTAKRVFGELPASPDLFVGLAGCGLFAVRLAQATNEPAFRSAAEAIGRTLVEESEGEADGCSWAIPAGYGDLAGSRCYGFAHGAAGIGYFLLELFELTGNDTYLDFAFKAATFIEHGGQAALPDGSGINWPIAAGGEVQSLYWCHGATGIGRFLLRLYELSGSLPHLQLAQRAAKLVAEGGLWLNPTQCHGLSGSIEFLIEMYQAENEARWLTEARAQARILRSHAIRQDGHLVWPSEEPTIVTPDYMVGMAGVGESFLRLAAADSHPYFLSSKYCSGIGKRPLEP